MIVKCILLVLVFLCKNEASAFAFQQPLIPEIQPVDNHQSLLQIDDDWSPLTRDLLGLKDNDNSNTCTLPDSAFFLDLSNDLAEANAKYRLSSRLKGVLRDLMLKQEPLTNVTLRSKLEKVMSILHMVCSDESALPRDGPRAKSRFRQKPGYYNTTTYPLWNDSNPEALKLQIVKFTFTELSKQFSTASYKTMIASVLGEGSYARFQQGLQQVQSEVPHCDSSPGAITTSTPASVAFPGGPFRLNFNFNLAQWLSQQLVQVAQQAQQGSAGGADPVGQMMSMMAVMAVISVVETVVGIIIDIVPPMIPPPFWILWAFPCLPMLTGKNCLWSVLYPISIADFMLASTTDSVMDGILSSFPSKYAMKVGKTSDTAYKICAMSYLGMNCASIFPMCWLPLGVMEAMSFPMCFMHCILTLVACPGFWIDDIMGPCMSISVPPLCAFSLFLNTAAIPPQYVSFSDGHPYPQECPAYDPNFDLPATGPSSEGLLVGGGGAGGLEGEGGGGAVTDPGADDIQFEESTSLVGDLSDWANVVVPQQFVCDCDNPCYKVAGNVPPGDCSAMTEECAQQCGSERPESVPITTTELPSVAPLPQMDPETYEAIVQEETAAATSHKDANLGHIYPVI